MADPLLDDPEYKARRSQVISSRVKAGVLGTISTACLYGAYFTGLAALGGVGEMGFGLSVGIPALSGALGVLIPTALVALGLFALYKSYRFATDQQAGMEEINATRSAKALAQTTLTVQPAQQPSVQQEQARADGQSWVEASKANTGQQVAR